MLNQVLTFQELDELRKIAKTYLFMPTEVVYEDGAKKILEENYYPLLVDLLENKISINQLSDEQIDNIIFQLKFDIDFYESVAGTSMSEQYYHKTIQWLQENKSSPIK